MSEEEKALIEVPEATARFNIPPRNFSEAERAALLYSQSSLIPVQFRGKPNDCLIIIQLANRQNVDPFMLMQYAYIVQGRIGLEGKYAIALMNARRPFRGGVHYDYEGLGDTRSCVAWAVHAESGERCSVRIGMDMAKREGWLRNPKWTTMRDQMLAYRAGAFLARLFCPEVLMGMQTKEELEDILPPKIIEQGPILMEPLGPTSGSAT